jgi:hypothetical protein
LLAKWFKTACCIQHNHLSEVPVACPFSNGRGEYLDATRYWVTQYMRYRYLSDAFYGR